MMNSYFGDNSDPSTAMIWAEEQFTAWLLDGGLPLILVYLYAVVVTVLFAYRVSLSRVDPEMAIFAAVICAYDVGALATCFSYPFFGSQSGMEFWMINAVLFAVASRVQQNPEPTRAQ